MVAQRDSTGRFVKGHSGYKENKKNILKAQIRGTKKEIVSCAHSLLKPWVTLKEDLARPEATRLEYLTAQAVSKGNTKFVQWLLEMAVGKPKQEVENSEIGETYKKIIRRTDGTTIEYTLGSNYDDSEEDPYDSGAIVSRINDA